MKEECEESYDDQSFQTEDLIKSDYERDDNAEMLDELEKLNLVSKSQKEQIR